jgi:hypothetical protein
VKKISDSFSDGIMECRPHLGGKPVMCRFAYRVDGKGACLLYERPTKHCGYYQSAIIKKALTESGGDDV